MADVEEGEILEVDVSGKSIDPPRQFERRIISTMNDDDIIRRAPSVDVEDHHHHGFWPRQRALRSYEYNHGLGLDGKESNYTNIGKDGYENLGPCLRNDSNWHDIKLTEKARHVGPFLGSAAYHAHSQRTPPPYHRYQRNRYPVRRNRYSTERQGFRRIQVDYEHRRYSSFRDHRQTPTPHFNSSEHPHIMTRSLPKHNLEHDEKEPEYSGSAKHQYDRQDQRLRPERSNEAKPVVRQTKEPSKAMPDISLEKQSLSQKSDELIEQGEYDLDDFQLLLERHRLIQQQLTAIGRQELDLEGKMSYAKDIDNDPDFVVIPNPNSVDDEEFQCDHNFEGIDLQKSSMNPDSDLQISGNIGTNFEMDPKDSNILSKENSTHVQGDENANTNEQVSDFCNPDEIYVMLDDYQDPSENVNEIESENPFLKPVSQKAKKGNRRRQRRKKFKNLNPNLQSIARAKIQNVTKEKKVKPSRIQGNTSEEGIVGRKKRKIETDENGDNYQSIPMDLEDEYEEIDSWVEENLDTNTQEDEPQISEDSGMIVADAKSSEEKALPKAPISSEVPQNKDEMLNNSDNIQQTEKEVKEEQEEDMEDVLFLRQQLLQSLATKRAEKARAMIAEQNSPSSPSHTEDSAKPEKLPISTTAIMPARSSPKPTQQLATVSRQKSNIPPFDRVVSNQEKVVIQIGLDSDSDDYHDADENENFSEDRGMGGAISDFLKEARHGTKIQSPSKSSISYQLKTLRKQTDQSRENTPDTVGNISMIENLEHCISNANTGLQNNREHMARDNNTVKLLLKKISLRKSRIEQQESKIKRLKQLLLTADKAKKTLTAQCLEFQDQVKSLKERIIFRNTKTTELEEELQRAKTLVSAANIKGSLNSPRRSNTPRGSPSNSDAGKIDGRQDGKTLLAEQISKSIAKMKGILAKKARPLPKSSGRAANPARRKSRQSKEEATTKTEEKKAVAGEAGSLLPNTTASVGNSLRTEKERLQKMELELRKKLEIMKKVSGALNRRTNFRKADFQEGTEVYGAQERSAGLLSVPNLDWKSADRIEFENKFQRQPLGEATARSRKDHTVNPDGAQSDISESSLTMAKERVSIDGTMTLESPKGHLGRKTESKLSSLFQDSERLEMIKQAQLQRESSIPNIDVFPIEAKNIPQCNVSSADQQTETLSRNSMNTENEIIGDIRNSDVYQQVENFTPYASPLLLFRSYRLSPWFRTKEKKLVNSNTYSHKINPARTVCPYDWSGKCLDKECVNQHASNTFVLTDNELLQDLILYEPRIAGINTRDPVKLKREKAADFIGKLKGKYGNKITIDHLVVLLIHDIKEFRKRAQKIKTSQIYSINLEKRQLLRQFTTVDKHEPAIQYTSRVDVLEEQKWRRDLNNDKEESQEVRYFEEEYDVRKELEKSVTEVPSDVKSWILLAKQETTDRNDNITENEDTFDSEHHVLNILSKALEANPYSEELWIIYLDTFSRRKNLPELREMFAQAIDYCRSYMIWWKCLELEDSYDEKIEICLDIIDFLLDTSNDQENELQSHRLFETILYIVRLELGRHEKDLALNVMRAALGLSDYSDDSRVNIPVLARDFTVNDAIALWLCLISLVAFGDVPSLLFDPADNGLSRIVQKRIGVLDWKSFNRGKENNLRSLFEESTKEMERHPSFTQIHADGAMQLYANRIQFEISAGNQENAVNLSKHIAHQFSKSPSCFLMLIKLIVTNATTLDPDFAAEIDSLILLPSDECIYEYSKYLLSKQTKDHVLQLLNDAVKQKFDFEPNDSESTSGNSAISESISLYRRLLGISNELRADKGMVSKDYKIDKSSRQYAYLWLNFCLLLELTNATPVSGSYATGSEEAFEIAVNTYTSRENHEILWLEYLKYQKRLIESSPVKEEAIKLLLDAGKRCLSCIPSAKSLPHQTSIYWNDYGFHNKIISICLQYTCESEELRYMKENLKIMPLNTSLASWLCHNAIVNEAYDLARTVYGFVLKSCPRSLSMWKMALSVELKSKKIKEARWLYEEATKKLPYSASLWKDFVLFEIAHGKEPRHIQTRILEIATRSTPYGILIMDYVRSLLK